MKSKSLFGIQVRETDISPWRSREMCVFLTVKFLPSIVENLNIKNFSSLVCEECEMCVRAGEGRGVENRLDESNKMKRLKESRMEA